MVHLFEWKWNDIAQECERFLGPKGFAGVQISPPQEHPIYENPRSPWWQRYQPVSYKLVSRSGNEQELAEMIRRCNAVGVRIYADAIINHMSRTSGYGTAGTYFDVKSRHFPGVPYSGYDFNDGKCNHNIMNYGDIFQVRNCKLDDMPDLSLEKEYVRDKVVKYLNSLIALGVAGFRVDAAKHMWPGDLQVVVSRLNNLREDVFGANKRPFIFYEVIDQGGEPIKSTEYTHIGRVTEFKYGKTLSEVVYKRYNQRMAYLKNFGEGWGFIPGSDSIAFLDNHDNQRGHGGGGDIVSHKNSRSYKIAMAFMLAWPYGITQFISSYAFDSKLDWQGPPSNNGIDTKDVIINSDNTCGNDWICEHRWRQVYNMVQFRNVALFAPVQNWWSNDYDQIAFSRGNRAFIAINNEEFAMDKTLQTGLPQGDYCDVISGEKVNNNTCSGEKIHVNGDGTARIVIKWYSDDPVVAIHLESKLD